MFNGSRFFHLLRKWKEDDESDYISILKDVMDHYFDSLAGTCIDSSKLKVRSGSCYGFAKISYVLDKVGYHNYSVEFPKGKGIAIVTLRNSL